MIKINTLTEEEIDNIPICEIDLSRRTLTVLMNTHYRDNIDNSVNDLRISDELIKLNELLKSGALSQEEFDKAKKKLLDN